MQTAITTTHQNLTVVDAMPAPRDNPAFVYIASRQSKTTKYGAERSLDAIARLMPQIPSDAKDAWKEFPWHMLRIQDVSALRSLLAEQYAPTSANKHLAILRGVLKESWRLGYIDMETLYRMTDGPLKNVKGKRVKKGRALDKGEIEALTEICTRDQSPAGVRDAAIIGIMTHTSGCRRAEIVSMSLDDWNPKTGKLLVKGKGNKERWAFPQNGVLGALKDWLKVRGDEPGSLFCPVDKGGRITIRQMSTQAIYSMLKKRAEESRLDDFSPHDLRRTFVVNMLRAGTDDILVSKLVGHESVDTTKGYDVRPEDDQREAVSALHFPWKRRYAD